MTKIYPFTIELYEKHKNTPGVEVLGERDEPRRILCTDNIGTHPVIALTPHGRPLEYFKDSKELSISLPMREVWKPWEFNTRPRGQAVFVYKKGFIMDCLITAWHDNGVTIANQASKVGYGDLMRDWLQSDGKTCGTLEMEVAS